MIGSHEIRDNSSPYPMIPASYYVTLNKEQRIEIVAFDADSEITRAR